MSFNDTQETLDVGGATKGHSSGFLGFFRGIFCVPFYLSRPQCRKENVPVVSMKSLRSSHGEIEVASPMAKTLGPVQVADENGPLPCFMTTYRMLKEFTYV